MSKKDNSSGKFILGAAFGAVVGGALAYLFAPRSGEETRKKLEEGLTELKDKANEFGQLALEKTNSLYDEFVGEANEEVEPLKGEVTEVESEIELSENNLSENFDSILSGNTENDIEVDFGLDGEVEL